MSADRTREIPVLPLPDAILFPRTIVPLQILESRYRQLIDQVVEQDGELGIVLLRPGWETDYYENPNLFTTGCLAQVSEHERLSDGATSLLLHGVQRFSILEFIQSRPYRIARVRLLDEVLPERWEMRTMARQLVRYYKEMARASAFKPFPVNRLGKVDFVTLVNSICSALHFSVYEKQRLLELEDVRMRGEAVLEVLRTQVGQARMISRFRHLEPQDSRMN